MPIIQSCRPLARVGEIRGRLSNLEPAPPGVLGCLRFGRRRLLQLREIYSVLLDPTATVHPRGDELAARRNVLGMSQKGIAEKLGVPNARISEIEGEKRLYPGIRAEYDRLLSVLLENQIQA